MNYHGMPPEQHFEFMFRAKIEPTGKVRTNLQDMLPISYSDPMPVDIKYKIEREISITLGENDYENFIHSYGKYLELTYAVERDPIVRDMFEKMIMYMRLKH